MEPKIFFIETLGSLYRDVQEQKIFPDSKYFVDCIPNADADSIVQAYKTKKGQPGFDLKIFVTDHFIFPVDFVSIYRSGNKPIMQHLEGLWAELTRQPDTTKEGTLIPLPFPYVVPGGRFREVYYWDSYFTMLGLQVSKKIDTMQHMIDNFAWLIDRFGFIPNGNRTYYLSRSQPPFFTLMVELLAEEKGENILFKYLPQLEKEYAFWMDGENNLTPAHTAHRHIIRMQDGSVLNRYWDNKDTARPEAYREDSNVAKGSAGQPELIHTHIRAACESGWDFSSRWFKDGKDMASIQAASLIPVDLNCLLLHTEEVLLTIYTHKKENDLIKLFTQKISTRKKAIQQYCWKESPGFYFDYHFIDHTTTGIFTLAAVYPLFFSVADDAQAALIARVIEEKFLQIGGLLTTLNQTGQQCDSPNGWAPLQWMAYKGLKNYGYNGLANEIKKRWVAANEKVYSNTGKLMEKYNVTETTITAVGGEYPNQDGFGWTNGVYLKFSQEK
ncbi:MAG: alpha,alpha-trehalase [Chitinophagaceae bacterium]